MAFCFSETRQIEDTVLAGSIFVCSLAKMAGKKKNSVCTHCVFGRKWISIFIVFLKN